MTIFYGFADRLSCPAGGGHEAGTAVHDHGL